MNLISDSSSKPRYLNYIKEFSKAKNKDVNYQDKLWKHQYCSWLMGMVVQYVVCITPVLHLYMFIMDAVFCVMLDYGEAKRNIFLIENVPSLDCICAVPWTLVWFPKANII